MIPRRFFWLFDFLIICVAFIAAHQLIPYRDAFMRAGHFLPGLYYVLDVPSNPTGHLQPIAELLWIPLIMALAALIVLGVGGGHDPLLTRSLTRVVLTPIVAILAGLNAIALVMFALKSSSWSRLLILFFTLFCAVGLVGYRVILRRYFNARRAAGYYYKNVLFIGLKPSVEWMLHYFKNNIPSNDYRPVGYLSVGEVEAYSEMTAPEPDLAAPLLSLGPVEQLGDLLIHHPIHEVIAISPGTGGEWVNKVVEDCDYFAISLRIVPEALLRAEPRSLRTLFHSDPLHLPAVILSPPHTSDSEALFFKRLLDIFVSATLLVLVSPLLALIAIAIKLTTPGLPIFYRWKVVGRNGVDFIGYKFTTMALDAERIQGQLAEHNEMVGPVFKIRDDPRVTRLGRFLRKYSLNELPQLWSVLKGDMSLVGPRPAFRHELQRYEFWHKRKLSIQPGITCLWQVRGRNKINKFDDWVNMDLEYIDNWSLWLDVKILIRTAKAVIAGTGW
jgi:exopolysaccharide biosynthesis polyprenyl glycosylphosphotransferase